MRFLGEFCFVICLFFVEGEIVGFLYRFVATSGFYGVRVMGNSERYANSF